MNGACPLWDAVEQRHHDEVSHPGTRTRTVGSLPNQVAAAAKKAQEAYKEDHPDAEEADLKVDLPPPPKPGQVHPGMPGHPMAALPPFARMGAIPAVDFQARQQLMQRMQQQRAQLRGLMGGLDDGDDDPLFGFRGILARRAPLPPAAPRVPPAAPRTRAQVAAAAAVRVPVAGPARPRKRKR